MSNYNLSTMTVKTIKAAFNMGILNVQSMTDEAARETLTNMVEMKEYCLMLTMSAKRSTHKQASEAYRSMCNELATLPPFYQRMIHTHAA